MAQKEVSVRITSQGGDRLRAELIQIGQVGERSFGKVIAVSDQAKASLQNAGFQVQDFFVQVAAGTSPTQALSQQLPQLLSGMGMVGILAGTAVAAVGGLGMAFLGARDDAVSLQDATAALGESIAGYQQFIQLAAKDTAELSKEFGEFSDQIQGFAAYMAGVALGQTMDDLRAAITPLKGELAGVEQAVRDVAMARDQVARAEVDLASGFGNPEAVLRAKEALQGFEDNAAAVAGKLGLTVDQALELAAALDRLGGSESMADIAEGAGAALALIQQMVPAGYELPPALRETVKALEEMQRQAAGANVDLGEMPGLLWSAETAAESAAEAVAKIGAAAEGSLAGIAALAEKMWEAAQARIAAEAALDAMRFEFSPGGQAMERYGSRGTTSNRPVTMGDAGGAVVNFAPRSSGGGSAQNDMLREAQRLYEATRTEAEKFAAEQAKINELLRAGAIDGDTHARALDMIKDKYGETSEAAKFLEDTQQDLKDAFTDLALEGEASFDAIGKAIRRALLEAMLWGDGPLGGLFGAKGLFGGAMDSAVSWFGKTIGIPAAGAGVKSMDGGGDTGNGPRSGGVDGKGGFWAILHPQETVIDHTKPDAPSRIMELAQAHAVLSDGEAARDALMRAPSFNGGGATGNAARSGGLDGKGGFLAMLHPQETVIDHTKPDAAEQSLRALALSLRSFDGGGQTSPMRSTLPTIMREGPQVTERVEGGGNTTVVQINNYSGQPVTEERERGPSGEEIIRVTVGRQLASGEHDKAMGRYSARPAKVKR
ncbi:hypothetical protein [Tabrizicola sp. M-4]|uniref:hypothetical protein n=1 Tax=Tabrizicola sp. M-4 TaxID=3055847 RepID=UPI003DA98AE1